MQAWTSNPTFTAYAITSLVLCANLFYLWAKSGAQRNRSKTVMNAEDARTISKGASVVASDPPEVARVLRAHANAMAVNLPFLMLGLLYVMAGGTAGLAYIIFGVFVAARLLHSFAYLNQVQPWRTISFVVSAVAAFALLGDIAWMLKV